MRIAIVANSSWYVYNFRRNLMKALLDAGHEVVVLAGADDYVERLRSEGWTVFPIPFTGSGTNPFQELKTVLALREMARSSRFDVLLSYTPKGNIYTYVATLGFGARRVPNISGLGRAFVENGPLARLARVLYRFALRGAWCVFFQNRDDRALFETAGIVQHGRSRLLPGSGVDLAHFTPTPLPAATGRGPRFLMVARLLREKGVEEFVGAAEIMQSTRPDCSFALLGPLDATPGRGVDRERIAEWVGRGLIDYLGTTDDVRPHLAASDCVVLPSYYREGVPRSLLEGAAMARPLITTDTPGCRDCVSPGINGFIVQPRDPVALSEAVQRVAGLSNDQRQAMGDASRAKVEREFSEERVISAYLQIVNDLAHDDSGLAPIASLRGEGPTKPE